MPSLPFGLPSHSLLLLLPFYMNVNTPFPTMPTLPQCPVIFRELHFLAPYTEHDRKLLTTPFYTLPTTVSRTTEWWMEATSNTEPVMIVAASSSFLFLCHVAPELVFVG